MTKKRLAWGTGILIVLAALGQIFVPAPRTAHAQGSGPSAVQQTATMLNVATKFATTTAVVNSQVTATMTPSGSNSVYITGIDFMACQNGTATAVTNGTFTSTNITGSPVWQVSLAATANLCAPVHQVALVTPLKSSTAGAPVTIVSPAAGTNLAYTITVSWYEAP